MTCRGWKSGAPRSAALIALLAVPMLAGGTTLAAAQAGAAPASAAAPPAAASIADALRPKGLTRGLSLGQGPAAADDGFVKSLPRTRSLSTVEREKLSAVAANSPTIDLEIPFDFNSAVIGPRAQPAVDNLGAALARPEFKGSTFSIAGHTDAKGGDEINQSLSERRAEAVKRYLVNRHGIAEASLVTVGYGKTHLKNPADPNGDENRRVQTTNLTDAKSASNR